MRLILTAIGLFVVFFSAQAQEMQCQVSINYQRLENTDKTIFEDMEVFITEFINNRKWTNHVYKEAEKIEWSVLIELTNVSDVVNYEATIQVQVRRPVYNTTYYTPIFSFKDENFSFVYDQNNLTMDFSENTFTDNLTSTLAYYCYMVLDYDSDSFSNNGGTVYFTKAQQIVANAQSSSFKGWSSSDKRNRYWLVENHLSPRFKNLRRCYYEYHRLGLDQMSKDVDAGRAALTRSLMLLEDVHRNVPVSFNMRVFFDSKVNEVIKIYQEANRDEQDKVMELLNKIDPANTIRYGEILN
ncbi:DUF4835 family protein [bacterium SCSIO 12741]|nr:DUF4835 family protein [bacterium SCSIO 12741]